MIAELGLKIDSSQAAPAAAALDKLTASAAKTEAATTLLSKAAAAGSTATSTLGKASTAATTATNTLAQAHGGMSTQAMAAAHAMRSSVEMLAQGVPVSQVLAMHMNQLSYAATGPGGISGAFKEAGAVFTSFVTPTVAVGAALLAIPAAATLATTRWVSAQHDVTIALGGIGRASGITRDQINSIADAATTVGGVSISQARIAAAAYAAMGTIAANNIQPAVTVTNDLAHALGVNVTDATSMLAKSLADPIKGVEALNEKLGAWDDNTKTLIVNQASQGNLMAAQKLIIDGVATSTAGATKQTGFWTATLNGLTNLVSNTADKTGSYLGHLFNVGTTASEQLVRAQSDLASLQTFTQQRTAEENNVAQLTGDFTNVGKAASMAAPQIAKLESQIASLKAQMQGTATASAHVASNLDSLRLGAAIGSAVPEVGARNNLNDKLAILQAQRGVGGLSADNAAALDTAIARTVSQLANVKSAAQLSIQSSNIAVQAANARSPAELAAITRQQTYLQLLHQGMSAAEAASGADAAAAATRLQAATKLTEAAKDRVLSIKDAIGASEIDIKTVGASIEQTTLLKANWQAYTDLRREAEHNHVAFDTAQYNRLVALNEQEAKLAQTAALTKLQSDTSFATSQIGRSSDEQQVASSLRNIYGDDYQSHMNDAIAMQMRFNQQLQLAHDTVHSFGQDMLSGLQQGKTAWESFGNAAQNALNKIESKLLDKALDSVLGLSGGGGGLLGGLFSSIFGGGGGSVGMSTANATSLAGVISAKGNVFDKSGYVPFANGGVVTRPTLFPFAGGTGLMGEAGPEAIIPLTRTKGGALGVRMSGGGGASVNVPVEVNIIGAPSEPSVKESQTPSGGRRIDVVFDAGVATSLAKSGSLSSKAINAGWGTRQKVVRR